MTCLPGMRSELDRAAGDATVRLYAAEERYALFNLVILRPGEVATAPALDMCNVPLSFLILELM